MQYKTTPFFLESFGLRSLDDLPELELEPGQPSSSILASANKFLGRGHTMRIGLHVHVAGGYAKAVEHAKAAGCNAMQVFSTNPRSYRTTAIDGAALENFARLRREAGIDPCAIHTPYLINLASAMQRSLRARSTCCKTISRLRARWDALGQHASRLVWHARPRRSIRGDLPGAGNGAGRHRAGVFLVLENSAGAGNLAGGTLEELGAFAKSLAHPQLGICLDTAHAWAAGYAIDSKAGVDAFWKRPTARSASSGF